MPELPEVETSRRGITPHIDKQVLKKVVVRQPKMRWPVPTKQLQTLEGLTLLAVARRGKYLQLQFDCGQVLLHLGMSGSLRIVECGTAVKKHDHIDFEFANGKVLRLHDPRRFGCCLYHSHDEPEEHKLLAKLGPEPLSDDFSFEYFYQQSRKKKKPVKQWLMDSHLVVGVGNIYACESLFQAGIRPTSPVGKISKARLEKLYFAVREILAKAIEQGGTTLKDFVSAEGSPGYFKQELAVYGHEGEACGDCQTVIKNIKLSGRSSFYCPNCQSR